VERFCLFDLVVVVVVVVVVGFTVVVADVGIFMSIELFCLNRKRNFG
jgi:hypothetical protein